MRFDFLAVNIVSTMFFALIIVFLSKILYSTEYSAKKILIFILLFGFINGTASHFINFLKIDYFIIKSIITFCTSFIIIRYILNFDIKKSIILLGVHFLVLLISESITFIVYRILNIINLGGLIDTFKGNLNNFVFGNILVFVIASLTVLLINLFKVYIKFPKNVKTITFTLIITTFTIAVNIWFIFYNIKVYTSIIPFIIVSVLVLIYCIYIIFNLNVSYRLERQSIELEQQKFYNESIEKALDNLKRFKHGYNNNLNILYCFAKSGDGEKLLDYFNEVMGINDKLNDTAAFNIKNAALYGIISSKVQYAEELSVEFKIIADSEIMEIKNIRMPELCELIGIFLDNAIEAAAESEDKIAIISITQDEEYISILIKNSYKETPDLDNIFGKSFSTKGDGRGMGLFIARNIIKNNKYVLNNTYLDKDMLCQELIIRK
jgi:two-component system sensor histidine kinase AgrC